MSFCLNSIKSQEGASMVETMVALFVLVIGLLGVFNLQAKSTKFSQSAYYYTQAVYLANDIAERIRTSPDSPASYAATITGAAKNCDQAACTDAELKTWHVWTWKQNVAAALPGGAASLNVQNSKIEIVVSFDDSKTDGRYMDEDITAAQMAAAKQNYSLMMEI